MLPYNHLYLVGPDFVYTRLQGLIWAGDGLSYNSKLNSGGCQILIEIIKTVHPELPLIVNCKRIKNFDESIYRIIKEKNLNRKIIFTHVDEGFHLQFATELENVFNGLAQQNKTKHIISNNHSKYSYTTDQYDELCKNVDIFIDKKNKSIVESCFDYYNPNNHTQLEQLPSTAIFSTGEFDAAKIISNPGNFLWLTLSFSDLVEDFSSALYETYHDNTINRLISVSLRGSPFAAAISLLSNPEIKFDTVDHLGPKHKLFDLDFFEKLKTTVKEKIRYIYIGDFIIGGTEIKIAQTYAQIYGFELKHAVVLGSFFDLDRFSPNFSIKSLVNIKDLNISNLKFVLER